MLLNSVIFAYTCIFSGLKNYCYAVGDFQNIFSLKHKV